MAARRALRRELSSAPGEAERQALGGGKVELEQGNNLAFDHVQMYVSSLRPLAEYQQLEADVAAMSDGTAVAAPDEQESIAKRWRATTSAADDPSAPYTPF